MGVVAAPSPAPTPHPSGLRLARFDVDATPPIGSHLAYDPVTNVWDLGLRARGVVVLGAGQPIVLCAIDWIGIANEGHDAFRRALAKAAGTVPARVAVHTLHQHDAPLCDFGAEKILKDLGLDPLNLDGSFARELIRRLVVAVRQSLPLAQPVTHLGLGTADVRKVASNRRILGPDGRVRAMRFTTCTDPALRAEPAGVIDPQVSLVSFWNGNRPLALLSYYAVHPQSYYRTGIANPDFPGVARFLRQLAIPDALHVHFTGAAGNLGAGKYNDGAHENRQILAERLADGLKRAWVATQRAPISAQAVDWTVESVALPLAPHLSQTNLMAELHPEKPTALSRWTAMQLAWLHRCQAGHKMDIGCLKLGRARLLYLPGELFVEYQLAAKAERPDLFVALAAYGDYGPGYIGTAIAYEQGGYETSARASNVAPKAETVILTAIRKLLH